MHAPRFRSTVRTVVLFLAAVAPFLQAKPLSAPDGEKGYAWERSGEFEGDILMAPDDNGRNGLITRQRHWPNRTLIYEIADSYDKYQRNAIEEAIRDFNTKTCIKMRPREKGDEDYVWISGEEAEGCSSFVGRHGGKQSLRLKPNKPGRGCFRKGTIIHELLHALGFYHQQSAPERDNFVKILWNNIKPGRENNFQKYGNDTVTNYGVKYDYRSVMHYSSYAFSKNDEKTIVPLEEDVEIGQRDDISSKDIQKLHNMYKCPKEIPDEKNKEKSFEKDIDELETLILD